MPAFATLADPTSPVRVVLVGAGGMGKAWIDTVTASADVELVGLVDLDTGLADAALADRGLERVVVGTSVSAVAASTAAQAVINVTVPAAHHPVNSEALLAGLPVLCEKPIAPTVAVALASAATAEASGQLLMTSQSRRYYAAIAAFRDSIRTLGDLGLASCDFSKAPHFGGFREQMAHVLLVDMAIHAFDAARYLLDREPVAVYCEESNPSWSWFSADAAATAVFEFEGGVRFTYSGSWAADGFETSWNGCWRVNGAGGTATWNGEDAPLSQSADGEPVITAPVSSGVPETIAGSLAEFVDAIRTGRVPSGEVHANLLSLAMVEAAVRSAETGTRVRIADVIEDGYASAVASESRGDVREVLVGWGSAEAGLRP